MIKDGAIQVLYFEPGKKYVSKRTLSQNMLSSLKGELNVVDQYGGQRTLDLLRFNDGRTVKLLTKLDTIRNNTEKSSFLREVKDFKSDFPKFEARDYPMNDLHDRYILSDDALVLLGGSMKDLGNKESFAIILRKNANKDIFDTVFEKFKTKWKTATII